MVMEHIIVDKLDMPGDGIKTAAGCVVALIQVFLQHALAEFWVVPGQVIRFCPGFRFVALDEFVEFHDEVIPQYR